jgi:transposase InsO family protein
VFEIALKASTLAAIASQLEKHMRHTRGKPYHPMTQGKIERWHLSLKSRMLLENYYLPGDLERAIVEMPDRTGAGIERDEDAVRRYSCSE